MFDYHLLFFGGKSVGAKEVISVVPLGIRPAKYGRALPAPYFIVHGSISSLFPIETHIFSD